jgi:pimeloyl-ACP methyl ester carboxylesterase
VSAATRTRQVGTADGIELHVEQRGAGPPVVLANQFFGHPELYAPLLDDLARDHRAIAYDLRGTGRSTRRGPYDLATDARDLACLLREAAGAPAVVVAVGDGCNRAVRTASEHPELVAAVVSPGGNPIGLRASEGTEGLAASRPVLDALLQLLETDYRTGLRAMLEKANPEMDEGALRARVAATAAHCPAEAAVPRMHAWVADDASDQARALGDRLWLLEHGRNLWFGLDAAMRTRELLPEAHVEQVPDGPFARPDLTAALVRDLTARDRAGSSA